MKINDLVIYNEIESTAHTLEPLEPLDKNSYYRDNNNSKYQLFVTEV